MTIFASKLLRKSFMDCSGAVMLSANHKPIESDIMIVRAQRLAGLGHTAEEY
jgi:hypothetical protein